MTDRKTSSGLVTPIRRKESSDPRHYEAYRTRQTAGEELNLDVRDKNGDGCLVSYNYIKRVKYTSDRLVSIVGTDFAVTLEGKNIRELVKHLQDDKVRYVQEFNPDRFDNTPAEDEATIEKLTIIEN